MIVYLLKIVAKLITTSIEPFLFVSCLLLFLFLLNWFLKNYFEEMGLCISGNSAVVRKNEDDDLDKTIYDRWTSIPTSSHSKYNEKGERIFSEEYHKYRYEAEIQANLRNECFEKSKHAFSSGQKANAKVLSNEGKEHEAKMKQANLMAVQAIISMQSLETNDEIDLHGLHVAEAVEETKKFIAFAKKTKKYSILYVITGQGHHSVQKEHSVVKDAIVELAQSQKWKLNPVVNNPGKFSLQT